MTATVPHIVPLDVALQQAVAHHQAGRLQEAEQLYRSILQAQPDHPDANHNLGVLAMQANQPKWALPHFKAAIEANPNEAQFWLSYIKVLVETGQYDVARQVLELGRQQGLEGEAIDALAVHLERDVKAARQAGTQYRHALEESLPASEAVPQGSRKEPGTKPNGPDKPAGKAIPDQGRNPEPHEISSLIALFNEGRFTEAAAIARMMTGRYPLHPFGWKVLGAVFRQTGSVSDALAPLQNAAALSPNDIEVRINLGNALKDLGRLGEAEASYRRALQLKPDFVEAHNNLGNTLRDLGRLGEAEASYRQALQIKPDFAQAHYNLANVLQDLRRPDEAEASYRQALQVNPYFAGVPELHYNLGIALQDLDRPDEAEVSYRRALQIKPDYANAHGNLGKVLQDLGRPDEAEASFRRALEIEPDSSGSRLALAMNTLPIAPQTVEASVAAADAFGLALQELSAWVTSSPMRQTSLSDAVGSAQPFYLAYRYGNHVQLLSRYGDLVTDRAVRNSPLQREAARTRIRLAVVSRHFCRSSVWDIIVRGLLVHLDRQKFEVVLYHLGHYEDGETAFARSLADTWRDVHTVFSFNGWLDAMAADQPDIVFYPEIGMDPVTLRLATFRLAPLQVASWGHPITTGLPTIDVYFSGELLEPPDAATHYRERLVRLPGTGCCTTPIEVIPEALTELEVELASRGGTRFVIAQNPFKFDPADDALYASIAAAVPDSIFILLRSSKFPWATDLVVSRLALAFRARGLVPEQHLLVIPWLSREKFYSLLDLCDIYLDCPSFSGYTTAWQAVHRGLPVVTLEGQFMRQRLAAGLLRKIDLIETIATSADHYVAIATRLAEEDRAPSRRNTRRSAIKSAAARMDNDVGVVRAFEQSLIDAHAGRALSP